MPTVQLDAKPVLLSTYISGGKYILFEAKLKARNPKESTPLNNIRWTEHLHLSTERC